MPVAGPNAVAVDWVAWAPVIAAGVAAAVALASLPIGYWLLSRREQTRWVRNERLARSVEILKFLDRLLSTSEAYVSLYAKRGDIVRELDVVGRGCAEVELRLKALEEAPHTDECEEVKRRSRDLRSKNEDLARREDAIYRAVQEALTAQQEASRSLQERAERLELVSSDRVRSAIASVLDLVTNASDVGSIETTFTEATARVREFAAKLPAARAALVRALRSDLGT